MTSALSPSKLPPALCGHLPNGSLEALFRRYGITLHWVEASKPIPGSHWGEPEAGILAPEASVLGPRTEAGTLFVRADTPVHSALHEGCHLVCMDADRRSALHTDAGGEDTEECGVCYLQILLADDLPTVGSQRLCRDMDDWGYSFRLGSTQAWFEEDAADARQWLVDHGLIQPDGEVIWRLRH